MNHLDLPRETERAEKEIEPIIKRQKGYRIMGYKCPVCPNYFSLPCRCDCGRRARRVRE